MTSFKVTSQVLLDISLLQWLTLHIEGKWCIYVSMNYGNISSDNGLSHGQHQAITWTNVALLSIGTSRTNFNEILIEIQTFPSEKMHLKITFWKWQPFSLGMNVFKIFSTPDSILLRLWCCWQQSLPVIDILLAVSLANHFNAMVTCYQCALVETSLLKPGLLLIDITDNFTRRYALSICYIHKTQQ